MESTYVILGYGDNNRYGFDFVVCRNVLHYYRYSFVVKARLWTILWFILTISGGGCLNALLRDFFKRERPANLLQYDGHSYSFPRNGFARILWISYLLTCKKSCSVLVQIHHLFFFHSAYLPSSPKQNLSRCTLHYGHNCRLHGWIRLAYCMYCNMKPKLNKGLRRG